ncbi:MAG: adenylate cyclase [Bacteroidetes bacterium]|nr:MAG: adenylate cyclase [Bacteroidota bacterium]
MSIEIIEIKARCTNPDSIREKLQSLDAKAIGTDHQVDTYFTVPEGRLKLRRGNIENTLIQYRRSNESGPKLSKVNIYKPNDADALHVTLSAALPVLVEVDKQREIYFIDNVKFHIDQVKTLGSFIEIEAIDESGGIGITRLNEQCEHYLQLFEVEADDLMTHSYSDMLLELNGK